MSYPIEPPIEPMLAKLERAIPEGDGWLYEPKWDGFRALVFRDGDAVYTQSRDLRPLDRYFPELQAPFRASLPERCVLDGEIVIAGPKGLDFEALQLRLHPAASRVALLAGKTPASFVAFDLLALGDEDLRRTPQRERRLALERCLAGASAPVHVTPATTDRALAEDWFRRFEGAGLDGIVAKRFESFYSPGKRVMTKVKHARTADCVVAGFRWHKHGKGTLVGSLLLGLYDDSSLDSSPGEESLGRLVPVGVTSSFTMKRRAELVAELAPLREGALAEHPWQRWAGVADALGDAPPVGRRDARSRWSPDKDLSFEPLRIERVCEVGYDHLQGKRFRHATTFVRWRPDKRPEDCRFDQLEVTPAFELARVLGEVAGTRGR